MRSFRLLLAGFLLGSAAYAFPNPDGMCEITTTAVLGQGTVNVARSYQIASITCGAARTFELIGGTLPTGMSLDGPTGVIYGEPTEAGIYSFTLRLRDSGPSAPSKTFILRINDALQFDRRILATASSSGSTYSDTVAMSGGVAPYTYAVSAGTLPPGLTLNTTTGAITGTVGAGFSSPANFTVQVTDSASPANVVSHALQIVPNTSRTIATLTLPNGATGAAYSATVVAPAPSAGIFRLAYGALPPGLTLNATTGVIAGTPTTDGSYWFTVQSQLLTGGTISAAWRTYNVIISNITNLTFTTTPLPPPGEGVFAYRAQMSPVGGVAPFAYAITSGTLPTGWVLDTSTGVIHGETTSAAASSANVTLQVSDARGATFSNSFPFTVAARLQGFGSSIPAVTAGVSFSAPFANGSAGVAPYSYSFYPLKGTLPPGLTLNASTGVLSGTPTTASYYSGYYAVTDAAGGIAFFSSAMTVQRPLTILTRAALVDAASGSVYSTYIVPDGGLSPYTYSVTAGTLPPGFFLGSSSGQIIGAESTEGSYSFTIQVQDAGGRLASRAFTLGVISGLAITTPELRSGRTGTSYYQQVAQDGGVSPVAFSLVSGTLPPGLTLSATGDISGTPTAVGTYNFRVRAQDGDSEPFANERDYTIQIYLPMSIVTASPLPNGTVSRPYSSLVSVIGGRAPYYFYTISGGILPQGLYLNDSDGSITGTPLAPEVSTPFIAVNDADGNTVFRSYSLTVNPALNITTLRLPNGTVATSYSGVMSFSGGTGSSTLSLDSGTLPPGLGFAPGFVGLVGTPTTAGTYTFTIRATDSVGAFDTNTYTVTISNPLTVPTAGTSIPAGYLNATYAFDMVASGGRAPYRYSLTATPPIAIMAIAPSTARYGGTPLTPGIYTFTETITDADGRTASGNVQHEIYGPPVLNPPLPGGSSGVAYAATVNVSGGYSPFLFQVVSGTLPPGLTMDSAGLVSGTPTSVGTFSFNVTVIDSTGLSDTKPFSIQILTPFVITTSSLPNGAVGAAYNTTIATTGGVSPVTFQVGMTEILPPGLSLNPSTGAITGTPTTLGSYPVQIVATDGVMRTAVGNYTLVVGNAFAITTLTLPNGGVGTAYSATIATVNGTAPVSFALTVGSGPLPAGLTLSPTTGAITGTPTAAGSSTFSITATDAGSQTAVRSYTVTIAAQFSITTPTLPNGTVGTAYSTTLATVNGTGAVTFAVTTGTLPAGLTLGATTGTISGTPTTAGGSTFTITATDSASQTAARSYTVTIAGQFLITTTTLPPGTVGTAYSTTLATANGIAPIGFAVTAGSLPAGLTLGATTGTISGTPTTAGGSTFTITATDATSQTAVGSFTIAIGAQFVISTLTVPNGTVGTAYSTTLATANGTGAVTFAVTTGTLPAGLTLGATTGTISGTPTTAGTTSVAVTATDAASQTASRSYTITIGTVFAITTATLPNGTVGTAYSTTLATVNGTAPVSFAVTSGALPGGLTLTPGTGTIAGTPTAAGTFAFTITATDAGSQIASASFSVTIAGQFAITTLTLPNGTVGTAYSATVTSVNGGAPVGYTVSAGALPAGLTLTASSGVVSGNPTTAGSYTFTVTATDAAAQTAIRSYTVTIAGPFSFSTTALPNGTVGAAYSTTLLTQNGVGAVTFDTSSGSLPPGLGFNPSTGVISGTPTTNGTSTITFVATDSTSQLTSRAFSITISPQFAITTLTLPNGNGGTAYSATIATINGAGAVTFGLTNGSLPAGLTLATGTGVISGTPTAAGGSTFTITATDAQSQTAQRTYTVNVTAPFAITTTTVPNGAVGTAYSTTIATQYAIGPVTFSVSVGVLPAGLTLNTALGTISGTPTTPGSATFEITATDYTNQTAQRSYTMVIANNFAITTTTLPDGTVGTAYTTTVATQGGQGALNFSVYSGALPAGLTMAPTTGVISGTPIVSGASTFTIRVVNDAATQSAEKSFTLTVIPQFAITTASLPNGLVGSLYSTMVQAQGGIGSIVFSLVPTAGSLPPGLVLDTNAGTIGGTPTTAGSYAFAVQAVDSRSRTASAAYSIAVGNPLAITTASVPSATVNAPFSLNFAATGGVSPYTWTITGGALPHNLVLASTGNLAGTVIQPGTHTFTVRVTDLRGNTAERGFTLNALLNLVLTANVFPLEQNIPFSSSLTAGGGRAPYTFAILSGAPPSGITFTPTTGTFSGTTAAAAGQYSLVAQVTDSQSQTASSTILFNVQGQGPQPLSISPPVLPNGMVAVAYAAGVGATGGTSPYTFSISQGQLPFGVTMNGAGSFSGTPTTAGTYTFGVLVTDGNGRVAGQLYTVSIAAAPLAPLVLTPDAIGSGTINVPYSAGFGASGGRAPYNFSLSGALPTGLAFTSSASIQGTPTVAGAFPISVTVTDSAGSKASKSYTVSIAGLVEITTASPLPEVAAGRPVSQSFGARGGTPPYTFAFSALPAGLSGNSAGLVTGTPTASGPFSFSVEATDARGQKGAKSFDLLVVPQLVITSTPGSTPVPVGQAITASFAATGGKPPYLWTVASGTLPPGVTLNGPSLSGTPTTPGTYTVTVDCTDTVGSKATASATIRVVDALTITTTSLPGGTVAVAYAASVGAAGGMSPYSFTVAQGALPTGVILAADGTFSGTPSAAGVFTFTVQATDAALNTATRAFSVTIVLPPLPPLTFVGTPPTITTGQQGVITIQLNEVYPVPITGTLTLEFTPNSSNPLDDPAVQLTTGGRTVTFTIPAGQTLAQFSINPLRFQVGTVAGTVRLRTQFTPLGGDATTGPEVVITVARSVPVITAASLTAQTGGFSLLVEGYSNTREVSTMTLQFTAAAGGSLETTTLTVPVTAAFNTWFSGAGSGTFGGGFRLTLPLTVTGDLSAVESVIIRLTNAVGESLPFTARRN